MQPLRFVVVCALVLGIAGAAQADSLLPLSTVADETGFGTLYTSLVSPYTGGDFMGTLTTRVYVDAVPATQVTFVYDLAVTIALTGVQDLSIGAVFPENDLRILEILNGTHGYVTGTTTIAPDNADAYNNAYPDSDSLIYGWNDTPVDHRLYSSDRAVMYMITSGAVDIGEVSAAIQDGGISVVKVLAPVDDPSTPDMSVPEPATLTLLVLGAMFIRRRR